MSASRMVVSTGLTAFAVAVFATAPALAEDKPPAWSDSAELSYVATSGNADSNTLGFKNTLKHAWGKSAFAINAGAVRAESRTESFFAVQDNNGIFAVDENSESKTTAEFYYLNGRFDRKITDRFFWYAGAGWDRNRLAGIQNRYTVAGGVGNIWFDSDTAKFRTDYALTWTKQDDVIDNPDQDDSFMGLRFSWDYMRKLGATATYTDKLVIDENLNESQDYRADWTNALAVSMSKRLALRVSLQWLYDNRPSFRSVDVYDGDPAHGGQRTGDPAVLKELDSLDNIFAVSLVVNF